MIKSITLQAARVNRGLTQLQVAKTLGITPPTLISWEKGRSLPNVEQFHDLATLYGVEIQDISLPKT